MADSQVPWGVDALKGTISEPAWKTKPSYYLVATDYKMIPPPAQRKMVEIPMLSRCISSTSKVVRAKSIVCAARHPGKRAERTTRQARWLNFSGELPQLGIFSNLGLQTDGADNTDREDSVFLIVFDFLQAVLGGFCVLRRAFTKRGQDLCH